MRNEEHSKINCIIDTVAQSFHRGCKSNSTVSRSVLLHYSGRSLPNCMNTE